MKIILPGINCKFTMYVFAAFMLVTLQSCSSKFYFNQSSVVPAAQGMAEVKKDHNNNYSINIYINHLAEPGRLQPPEKVYVVWMVTDKNGVKNIGQLTTAEPFFSSVLKGSLETVTPFKPVRFFVTAEDGSAIQNPGERIVLTTNYKH